MTESTGKELLFEQAKRYLDEGRVDRAIQEYQKIVTMDPRDYRVQLRIAELYVRLKQVAQAVRMYQVVASAYADEGFYLKAVTVYKNILRLNPALREVNASLAELYEKMGLAQDAVHQYQILATVAEQKGDQKGLLEIRRRIVALDPAGVTSRIRLAEAYQIDGQETASLQEYEILAEQLQETGTPEQLIDLYEKILTRRPDHLDLLQRLCHIYYGQREYKKALRRMEASEALVAKTPELLAMQAEIYFRLNQIETAKGKWRELAELYRGLGELDAALTACEEILATAPEEAEDLAELIEAIRPGALAVVKTRAEARRRARAEEERAEEKSSEERPTQAPSAPPPKPAGGPLAPQEAAALQKRVKASQELGELYERMGLTEEAAQEFAKALEGARRLAAVGAGGANLPEHGRALEQKEGQPSITARPTPKAPASDQAKRTTHNAQPAAAASAGKRTTHNEPPAKPPAGGEKKKRISFV